MKKHSKLRLVAFSFLVGGLATLAPACAGKAGEYCDIFCECERCNDRAEDLCHANTNAFLDEAEIYGCETQAEALIDCVISFGECASADYDAKTGFIGPMAQPDVCNADLVNWGTCLSTASALSQQVNGGAPNPPPGDGPSPEPATLPGVQLPVEFQAE